MGFSFYSFFNYTSVHVCVKQTETRSWAGTAVRPLVWSSVRRGRWSWVSWRWHNWWSGRWWTGCHAARWSCRRAPRNTSSGGCPVAWEASATSDGDGGDRGVTEGQTGSNDMIMMWKLWPPHCPILPPLAVSVNLYASADDQVNSLGYMTNAWWWAWLLSKKQFETNLELHFFIQTLTYKLELWGHKLLKQ